MQQLGFVLTGGDLAVPVDYARLAPDRPLYQCTGRVAVVEGIDGEVERFWPCGRLLPDLCFRPVNHARMVDGVRPVQPRCIVCEQDIRTAKSQLRYWEIKAGRVMDRHRRKERKQGLHDARTMSEYEQLTGLTRKWLARQMKHSAEHDDECPHCDTAWSAMPGGAQAQMSVDRPDVTRMLGRDNWALRCLTGNSQAGTTDARTRQVRDGYWRLVREELRET